MIITNQTFGVWYDWAEKVKNKPRCWKIIILENEDKFFVVKVLDFSLPEKTIQIPKHRTQTQLHSRLLCFYALI